MQRLSSAEVCSVDLATLRADFASPSPWVRIRTAADLAGDTPETNLDIASLLGGTLDFGSETTGFRLRRSWIQDLKTVSDLKRLDLGFEKAGFRLGGHGT